VLTSPPGLFRFIGRPKHAGGVLTTIQANASMRSIVHKDSGKGWKDYAKKLAKKAALEDPTDDELRQFDRSRPGKTVSNDDWENPHDPDAKITRMQNGTTRMASKVTLAADLGMRASIPKRASQKQQGWPSQAS